MHKTDLIALRAHLDCSNDDSSLKILPGNFRDLILSAIAELTELREKNERCNDLTIALRLAKDMFVANDISLPHTMEVIDDALSGFSKLFPDKLPCTVKLGDVDRGEMIICKGCDTSTLLLSLSRRAEYEAELSSLSTEERIENKRRSEQLKDWLQNCKR